MQIARRVFQQAIDDEIYVGIVDTIIVIQHQDQAFVQFVEIVTQLRCDNGQWWDAFSIYYSEYFFTGISRDRPQRCDKIGQKIPDIAIGCIQRKPGTGRSIS